MIGREICLSGLLALSCAAPVSAEVRVHVQDTNGLAWLVYECTAGEVVRAFALDVSVDQGQIVGISGFLRGLSRPGATGYGVFPAAYRDHLSTGSPTNIDWSVSDYTPLAVVADAPGDTLPGLHSAGVTLELGGLWDPTVPDAIPGPTGTLCALELSQPASVSVAANATRGGVVSAFPGLVIKPVFVGAFVGPSITGVTMQEGIITVQFQGGELQSAPTVEGPWTDTGDIGGSHAEPAATSQMKFFRVRSQ